MKNDFYQNPEILASIRNYPNDYDLHYVSMATGYPTDTLFRFITIGIKDGQSLEDSIRDTKVIAAELDF